MVDTSVPFFALKLAPHDIDHGMVGLIRSLTRLGVRVTAYHDTPRSPSALTRYRHRKIHWSIAEHGEEAVLDHLRDLARTFDVPPVTVASDDFSSTVLDDFGDELRDLYRFPEQPPGLARRLYDKQGMYEICKEHDVPTPETSFPQARADAEELAARAEFPIVIKGIDSSLLERTRGLRLLIVQDAQELLEAYDRLETPESPNLMLQEYIPGGADTVWMFDGYFDANSDCLFSVTGQKIRQYPAYTGMTSLGICVHNEEVVQTTHRLMKELGYRGILDCGYRYDARDGRYKLLDVNPRLGASFRLFVGEQGMDVVRALYLDMTGQRVPQDRARDGRKWVVENLDVAATRRYMHDGVLGPREWARAFRGVEEAGWWSATDPVPFFAMAARFVGDRLRKPARQGDTGHGHRDNGDHT